MFFFGFVFKKACFLVLAPFCLIRFLISLVFVTKTLFAKLCAL